VQVSYGKKPSQQEATYFAEKKGGCVPHLSNDDAYPKKEKRRVQKKRHAYSPDNP
jgi:hypothetical protein